MKNKKIPKVIRLLQIKRNFYFILYVYLTENLERWERSVQDEEDALEGLRAAEKRYLKEIDQDKEKMEKFKQEKQAKKQAVDEMEEDISKARKEVANVAKEIHNFSSQLSAIEAKIETKKNERHNILLQAKVGLGIIYFGKKKKNSFR